MEGCWTLFNFVHIAWTSVILYYRVNEIVIDLPVNRQSSHTGYDTDGNAYGGASSVCVSRKVGVT